MGQIEVFSPAKINLFLAVVGRLESDFHELASLVAPLDFGDRIRIETRPGPAGIELLCDDASLPLDPENLAWRAARSFLDHYQLDRCVTIHLNKRLPAGAGLGGGSSNAAAALEGLARLEGVWEDQVALRGLAAGLGSDCPLFLAKEPVIMRGRGERLERLAADARRGLRDLRVLVFKPSFSISTAWAYGALARDGRGFDASDWAEERLEQWQSGRLSPQELLYNRFEPVAARKYPALDLLKRRLDRAGFASLMSGSGSACFALLEPGQDEERLRTTISDSWGKYAWIQSAKLL